MFIESSRLYLRRTVIADVDSLYHEVFSDRDVVKYTFGRDVDNLEQATAYVERHCNFDGQLGVSTLVERETTRVIGLGGVLECDYLGRRDYEFGFILGKNHWGKGYATEIGHAQIDFIDEHLKADRVIALASKDNSASIKTLKKLGLSYLKTVRTEGRGDRDVFVAKIEAN